ncbi:MAG: hypothetical protein KGL45_05535 [Gammaproteobacteria bacterium]|nr:hypothetical protein [Gammaproteobacteria bacterium]
MKRVSAGALVLAIAALVFDRAAPADIASTQQLRGMPQQAVLTEYDPLFSNAEIMRRLLSPLTQVAVRHMLARTGKLLSRYPIDLTNEKFLVYVPSTAPPSRGYALLVFIPPWDQTFLPFGWASQLDRYGVILVSPASAGNTAAVLNRRVPLALSAETNIAREYPLDRQRVFIGGFSGGSGVALRIALGYPDVFRGALLNAGAAPLGGAYPLPRQDLFQRFRGTSHLVYVTGELDTTNLGGDAGSSQSMQDWCVFEVETHETTGAGHELMSAAAFGRALERLLSPAPADPARLGACRSRVQQELGEKLARAEALVAESRRAAARQLLLEIDERYGGLAAPRILDLARRCECGVAGS